MDFEPFWQVDREGREHIPMVSILLTSGISDEDRLKVILAGWRVQAATWCNAYSLGVGPFISEEEMFLLSGDLQHYQLVSSPDLLSDVASRPPLDEYLDIFFPAWGRQPIFQRWVFRSTHLLS
jgi:hypothetical protein